MTKKEYDRQRYIDNKKKIDERNRQYHRDNKESIKQYKELYYRDHKEMKKEWCRQWRMANPEKVKCYAKRAQSQRRSLGFFPLNEYFDGSEGHHISKNFVIYIPYELHHSIAHNIFTWHNMEQINKLAIEWL